MDSGSMLQNRFVTSVTSGHKLPSLTHPSQHYQLQGRDAGHFMLHHSTAHDTMMNHYLLGTDSLAPVQLRLGMLGLTNPTYEVCVLFPLSIQSVYLYPQAASRSRRLTSQAMYAILKKKDIVRDKDRDIQRNLQTVKTVLTKEEISQVLAEDATFQDAEREFSAFWLAWRAFYNDEKEAANMRKLQTVIKSGLRQEFNSEDEQVMCVSYCEFQSHMSFLPI